MCCAGFGSICQCIVVGDHLDVLSCAYSTSERLYEHIYTRTSSTTLKKMKTVLGFHFGETPNENRGWILKFIMDIKYFFIFL